jgi:hypothetical protein
MQIIEIDIEQVKQNYKKSEKIEVNKTLYSIGRTKGAREEFLLFHNGKAIVVFEPKDEKEKAFVIIN